MFMTDVLDNVVWGDNQSLASTALFAGQPSNTGVDGVNSQTFQIKRAWMEIDLMVGILRVGRQPSHWGMGLLANSGDGFDDAFGENYGGADFDRILFATRPIALFQKLVLKQEPADTPFYMGYAFDRLVSDPLVEYYGFPCEPGLFEGDDGFDPACDSDNNGVTDLSHDYTDDERLDTNRSRDWAMDNKDNVTEHVALAIYKGEDVRMFGSLADLTAGMYYIRRTQDETKSRVNIFDAYLQMLWKGFYVEGEVLNIRGSTQAIALDGAFDPDAKTNKHPLYKDVNILGYAARAGYKRKDMYALLETGFASGESRAKNRSPTCW